MDKEVLEIKFVTIDDWNRPIFKPIDESKHYYLSDVGNLFDYGTTEEQIKDFYKDVSDHLGDYILYHGRYIDTDPNGVQLKYELRLV